MPISFKGYCRRKNASTERNINIPIPKYQYQSNP